MRFGWSRFSALLLSLLVFSAFAGFAAEMPQQDLPQLLTELRQNYVQLLLQFENLKSLYERQMLTYSQYEEGLLQLSAEAESLRQQLVSSKTLAEDLSWQLEDSLEYISSLEALVARLRRDSSRSLSLLNEASASLTESKRYSTILEARIRMWRAATGFVAVAVIFALSRLSVQPVNGVSNWAPEPVVPVGHLGAYPQPSLSQIFDSR